MNKLEWKLKKLPRAPGVYFFKDKTGKIIYIGKAANLRNRVKQYFLPSTVLRVRKNDTKTDALLKEIVDLDWTIVESELDALFLEAEMVRRYMPRYNILLRDDKSLVYVRISYGDNYPTVTTTRRPLDDGARYFGPYLSTTNIRQALKVLRRIFPFASTKTIGQKRASLHYHLGLDPGLEEGKTNLEDYRANLRKLMAVIEGKRGTIEKELEKDMKRLAKSKEFEAAAKARNQLFALKQLSKQIIFSSSESQDISKDQALNELAELLSLKKLPRRIEGYDISHMSGSDAVASMVVFTNGVSHKTEYRKFKTRNNINDDFYNMHETITRRFSERNIKNWGLPDLILIDGGRGQVNAAQKAIREMGMVTPIIGLAKRYEQIIVPGSEGLIKVVDLPQTSHLIKLLQRIRDESHRFAVSYHSTLKTKHQTISALDNIPGIGPATRKKLIRTFGSMRGLLNANENELKEIVGPKKAKQLKQLLPASKN